MGCRADVVGLAAWDVRGGKKGTTYAAKLHCHGVLVVLVVCTSGHIRCHVFGSHVFNFVFTYIRVAARRRIDVKFGILCAGRGNTPPNVRASHLIARLLTGFCIFAWIPSDSTGSSDDCIVTPRFPVDGSVAYSSG